MAGLEPEEGDAGGGLDRDAPHLAGLAVHARGHVDGDYAPSAPGEGVDPLDDRPRFALDIAREARPEQGVDHAAGPVESEFRGCADSPLETRGGNRGVARERLAPAEEFEFDRVAPARQVAPR